VFFSLLLKCTAGTEALFADLGHFTSRSIQVKNAAKLKFFLDSGDPPDGLVWK
jgi:K+ transporter